jgi:predicted TIM-barrel fold metal-dependent hydrolase
MGFEKYRRKRIGQAMTEARLSRRAIVAAAGGASLLSSGTAQVLTFPIIDTHLHLYDPTRPQGAPFPRTSNARPFLPRDYRALATPLGITGGIKVEASPWVEDNLWVLMIIENEPIIVGMIGCLDPTKPEFREYLDRYHRNRLFLGIRYGNVWEGHNLVAAVEKPDFIANMKAFAQTGLTLEVANPRLDLIDATVRLTDKVPELRIVLGHLQFLPMPTAADELDRYANNLRELRKRNVYAKISGLPRRRANEQPVPDPAVYTPALDFIWHIFGEDYLVYAGVNQTALEVLKSYSMAKSRLAAEKFFWKNSVSAYRWVKRDPRQPQLA